MSYTAKSIILDIADNWGHATWLGLRALDFKLSATLQTIADADISATYGNEYSNNYAIHDIFVTALSKTGAMTNTTWLTDVSITNQRIICVFTSPVEFDEIVINNCHASGSETTRGIQNVKITISSDVITDTTYDAAIANSSVVYNSTFDQHVASDVADDQVLTLLGSTGLQDMKTDIKLAAWGRADAKTDIHAAAWGYAHTVLDLSAYFQKLEDFKLDIKLHGWSLTHLPLDIHAGAWGYNHAPLDLSAYFQKLEDMKLDILAWGDVQDDAKWDAIVAGWGRKNKKLDLFASAQIIESMALGIAAAKEISNINAMIDVWISNGDSLQDVLLDIEVSDGILLHDAVLDLAVIEVAPTFRAVYAMHLDSVVTEI